MASIAQPSTTPAPVPASPSAAAATTPSSPSLTEGMLLLVPGLIWGASFLFIAEGLRAVAPNGVTFLRILIGFTTLSLFPAARKPIDRADWLGVAALGVLWFALPLSMFPFAEQRVSSALAGMLNGSTPLFAALVTGFLTRKTPKRGIVAGLAVGLGGAILIALPTLREGRSSTIGILLILIALVSYGFAIYLARPLQQRSGALPVVWRALGLSVLLTAPLGIPDVLHAHWSPVPLLSLLALGALGTALAPVLTTIAAGRMGSTRASGTAFLIPGVALLLGVLVRGEQVAPLAVVGGAISVGGAWLLRRAQASG